MSRKRKEQRSPDDRSRGQQENRPRLDCGSAGSETKPRSSYLALAICALLLLAVAAVFGQTLQHDFVNYDDTLYLLDNRANVGEGLTASSIGWAFRTNYGSMWGPMTWLSHLLDCHVYGFRPWGHHLTNVLLHSLATISLFWVFWRMTGNLWPSALVAALFAIHPLHVETVAWIAERKGVLSGLFFVLTLAAYVRFVRWPFSWASYLLVIAMFVLGLMSKPVLVTLPFLLLLLDYWPLGRMSPGCFPRLIVEKLPMLALAVAACVAAPLTQGAAVASVGQVPIVQRIGDALVAYVIYLGQFLWPANLSPIYLRPQQCPPLWQTLGAAAILLTISAAAIARRRTWPWFFVGWFWFVGTLVPMIGLVPLGTHFMADRYTYVTQIGLYVAVAWGVARTMSSWSRLRWLLPVASLLVVGILMGCAWRQTGYWRDSESLWRRTLASTSDNPVAQHNLGQCLADRGRIDEAIGYYRTALEIMPDFSDAHYSLGVALEKRGEIDEAITHYQQAVSISPGLMQAQNNLGVALAKGGRIDEAIVHYRQALKTSPDYAEAHSNLAAALAKRGQTNEAMDHFREAVRLKPDYAQGHYNLGIVLVKRGMLDEAAEQFQEALRINPDYAGARQMLGIVRSEQENLPKTQH